MGQGDLILVMMLTGTQDASTDQNHPSMTYSGRDMDLLRKHYERTDERTNERTKRYIPSPISLCEGIKKEMCPQAKMCMRKNRKLGSNTCETCLGCITNHIKQSIPFTVSEKSLTKFVQTDE